MKRSELKQMAKRQIKGKIGSLFVVALIIYGISILASIIPVVGSIASLIISPALTFGMILVYVKLSRNETYKPDAGDAFGGMSNVSGAFKVYWAQEIFTFLWSLLFVIPGIIKSFAYSQAMYILVDKPDITGTDAIGESQKMMNGHKMDYFVLQLSFIGWHIVGALTLGIGTLWVTAYQEAATVAFYEELSHPYLDEDPFDSAKYTVI